jgi:hypothetical protein
MSVSPTLSLYDVTVPALVRGLGILRTYLDKAAAFAEENSIDPSVLVNARLAPDMQPLAGQIQRASDTAKGAVTRLTDSAAPSFPDTETTFAQLQERLANTIAFLQSVPEDQYAGAAERVVELKFRSGAVTLTGTAYALTFLLPNFYFHMTTAHDILRHNGIKVGKLDYIGAGA